MPPQLNWVDYVIVGAVVYFAVEGWRRGLPQLLASLASFLASLWFAVKYNTPVGNFLGEKFGLPVLWTKVLGYLIVAIVSETIISTVLENIAANLPKKASTSLPSRVAAALVSAINSLVITAFIVLVVLALPMRGSIKNDVKASVLAKRLAQLAERYGGNVTSSLEEATIEMRRFFTIEPDSKDRVPLEVQPKPSDLSVDAGSEERMVDLVDEERKKAGVGSLRVDPSMRDVARAHSRDMFERRYFSHYDTNDHDAAWRMEQAGIPYTFVGENLAFAPDIDVAHEGLMNSEGHRHNILDGEFHRIGIGVIDGGPNGKMFTQIFAD